MNALEARERALDDLLAERDRDSDAVAAPAGSPTTDPDLVVLAELARRLRRLPPVEGPTEAFRAALAARLVAAPAPGRAASRLTAPTASVGGAVPQANSTTDLVRALDRWLEDPEEAAAAAVPLPAELLPLATLAEALRGLPGPDGPSRSFRRSLAGQLADAPPPRMAIERGAATSGGWLRRLWRSTAFTAAAAATVLLFVAFGATVASASALPGHPLYPIKRTAEAARLWFADGVAAVGLHMVFGERRLDEALAVPDHAGGMLAEFSREATAALATADAAIARGEPRQLVSDPLLAWFLVNRTRLIDGRPVLPPTAWRGALALVDEAIRALSQQRPMAGAPVPRLADPLDLLAARFAARPSRLAAGPRHARAAGGARAQPPAAVDSGGTSVPAPLVVVISGAAAGRSEEPSDPAPTSVSPPPGGGRTPIVRPTRAIAPAPLPSVPPKPATPEPSATRAPQPEPTLPPVEPSVPPPTATDPGPIVTATSFPTATQPPAVTPTVPVFNKPPTILEVGCDNEVIELYASTTCRVVAVDPEGDPLYYLWMSDAPQMVNERQKDAIYYAAWGIGGGKMRVGITVLVSDRGDFQVDDPDIARARTAVEVRSLEAAGP